jgi:hypothetical protein
MGLLVLGLAATALLNTAALRFAFRSQRGVRGVLEGAVGTGKALSLSHNFGGGWGCPTWTERFELPPDIVAAEHIDFTVFREGNSVAVFRPMAYLERLNVVLEHQGASSLSADEIVAILGAVTSAGADDATNPWLCARFHSIRTALPGSGTQAVNLLVSVISANPFDASPALSLKPSQLITTKVDGVVNLSSTMFGNLFFGSGGMLVTPAPLFPWKFPLSVTRDTVLQTFDVTET